MQKQGNGQLQGLWEAQTACGNPVRWSCSVSALSGARRYPICVRDLWKRGEATQQDSLHGLLLQESGLQAFQERIDDADPPLGERCLQGVL